MASPPSIVAPAVVPQVTKAVLDANNGVNLNASRSDPSVQQKLDVLAARTESNTMQMEKMQDTVVQTKASMVDLNRTVTNLSGAIQSLNNNVQKIAEAQKKPKKIKKIEKNSPPKEIYHVKAVVSGMAWLESANGSTVTIRVGDELPGYGKVNLISPKEGLVITTSGTVIQYGVNDF